MLAIDADHRGAILGLQRTAARSGDTRTLARALLEEARLSSEGPGRLALQTRAASAFASSDPARARQLVRDVLGRDARNVAARTLEMRLEEDVGRWELAAKSLRARIDLTPSPPERVAMWIALAQMQHGRLRAPLDALASLEQARALDPAHPVPPEEIARVVEDHGDPRSLREAIERLAKHARSPEERARHIARAAELDELCLGDDASAMRTYRRALDETPDDELVAARLARVAARRARQGHGAELLDLAALIAKRIERAAPAAAQAMTFDLAALLVEIGQDTARATALLESTLVERSDNVPALRTLEALRRRSGEAAPLARVLTAQGEELKDVRARLGALWTLAFLEEWKLSASDPTATYVQILELDPTDPSALEALLRRDLPNARQGDPRARKIVFGALRALIAFASDDETRLSLQLRLALLLEAAATDRPDSHGGEELSREALDRYRDALRIDDLSPAAATGVARLATTLHDPEAASAAAASLAELAVEPRQRARYLVEGAEILLGPAADLRLGTSAERRVRAVAMLERALQTEPDSIAAAGRLATVLLEERQGERLVSAFREALAEAKSPDAMVLLGSEIARVARDELRDLTVAIDAMRRVRAVAPQHVPSLLTLAELCIAQRVWPEAVDALEAVVSTSREVGPKLTAFFALASIYEKVLARPEEVDRALRAALELDPANVRALRALLRRSAAEPMPADEAGVRARREEMADWLGRLADAEREPEQKSALLLELSEVHVRLGNTKAAERTLVEAVVTSPSNARAFSKLTALFRRPGGVDSVGFARALTSVISFGDRLGRVDARWLAALDQLEVHSLSRLRDGVAHLERAVTADPSLYETRFELAGAYAQMKSNDEATRVLLAMIVPVAEPLLSIADPAAGLSLLEQSLNAGGRKDEAVVVAELRALTGDLDETRMQWLRARRPRPVEVQQPALDRATLITHVLPPEGRHVLLEVAAAIAGVEGKLLRADLGTVGIAPRDKISSRSGHPTRALLDRVARQLAVASVELAVAPSALRMRVLAQDEPWIVVPPTFVKQPEPLQIAGLARAVARIAYGAPWLEELSPVQIEAWLVAAARQVVKGYGTGDANLVAQNEAALTKALSRRQRKLLEELTPHLSAPNSKTPPADDFVQALMRAELRAAFLVGGDLLAMLEEMRPLDAALHAAIESPGTGALATLLDHPLAGDLVRFALTPEATALRRRLGSTSDTVRIRSVDEPSQGERNKPAALQLELPGPAPVQAQAPEPARRASMRAGERRGVAPLVLVAMLTVVAVAGGVAVEVVLPRYVRTTCIEQAAAHGLVLAIDDVKISRSGFVLTGVKATAADLPGASVEAPEVDVETRGLRPEKLTASGMEIALDGRWSTVSEQFTRWRASERGGQEGAWAPEALVIDGSRIVWRGPIGDNARVEAAGVHLDVTWRDRAPSMHATSSHVTVVVPGGTLGPWRVDIDRDVGASRARVALDPGVPEASTVLVVGNDRAITSVDVAVPRSPIARLGIAPALLGLHGEPPAGRGVSTTCPSARTATRTRAPRGALRRDGRGDPSRRSTSRGTGRRTARPIRSPSTTAPASRSGPSSERSGGR